MTQTCPETLFSEMLFMFVLRPKCGWAFAFAFELENMETLENWNGDKSLLKNSYKHLEDLFEKIDKGKNAE